MNHAQRIACFGLLWAACLLLVNAAVGLGSVIRGTEIVFVSDRSGYYDLYHLDVRTRLLRQLTHDPNMDARPVWSPDGRSLLFQRGRMDGRFDPDLAQMDIRTRRLTPLADSVDIEFGGVWSPDGRWLAYARLASNTAQGVLLDAATGETTHSTFTPLAMAWSPDSAHIAYSAVNADSRNIALLRRDAWGRPSAVPLLLLPDGWSHEQSVRDVRWSPDGAWIAFVVRTAGDESHVFLIPAPTPAEMADGSYRPVSPRQLTDSPGANVALDWTPDSRHLIIEVRAGLTAHLDRVDVRTGARQPVMTRAAHPAVRP